MENVIKELEALKNSIINDALNPADLSEAIVLMSGYLIYLGGFVADKVYDANNAYTNRKFKYASDFNTLSKELSGKTMREMDIKTQISNKEHQDLENEKRHDADRVKVLYESYKLFIMVNQTRLSVLKSELFNKKEI